MAKRLKTFKDYINNTARVGVRYKKASGIGFNDLRIWSAAAVIKDPQNKREIMYENRM